MNTLTPLGHEPAQPITTWATHAAQPGRARSEAVSIVRSILRIPAADARMLVDAARRAHTDGVRFSTQTLVHIGNASTPLDGGVVRWRLYADPRRKGDPRIVLAQLTRAHHPQSEGTDQS